MPDQPTGADSSGAQKDLAFVGYVQLRLLLHVMTMLMRMLGLGISRYTFKRFMGNERNL